MKTAEFIRLMLVTIFVTIFVFFRCKSIFEEKDKPSQNHVTTEQCQEKMIDSTKDPLN